MQNNKALSVFNLLIIIYNFFTTFNNYSNGYFSYLSFIILGYNFFSTITYLKVNNNDSLEKVCLVIEIITGLILIMSII